MHRGGLATLAWMVVWLLVLEGALYMVGHLGAQGSARLMGLARYLEYGRSIEGKLALATQEPAKAGGGKVLSAGWLDPASWQALPDGRSGKPDQPLVAVYGQSFAFRTLGWVSEQHPSLAVRKIGGPAAPITHSLAAYQLDARRGKAQWVVLGVLASAMGQVNALSGMAFTFESPAPYTYPALRMSNGQWQVEQPLIQSESAFRAALARKGPEWTQFKSQLQQANPALDAFAMNASWTDHSALMRMVRRGWVTSMQAEHQPTGLSSAALQANVEALRRFKSLADQRGERLLVIVFRDRGTRPADIAPLTEVLEQLKVHSVDSLAFVNPTDARQFEADGHFKPEGERLLAEAVAAKLTAP
jgi:hypothetical protein